MANIPRAPLITRIEPKYPSAAAQMQPWRGLNVALFGAVLAAAPIIPKAWPNPLIPRYPVDLRTWFNFQTTAITTPVSGFDWINTRSAIQPQAQIYFPNVALLTTITPPLPAGVRGSFDQPNPTLPDRFSYFRWQQYPNFTVLPKGNAKPFLNVDWPNPKAPIYSVALRWEYNQLYIVNRIPVGGTSYPNTLSISVLSIHRIGF